MLQVTVQTQSIYQINMCFLCAKTADFCGILSFTSAMQITVKAEKI